MHRGSVPLPHASFSFRSRIPPPPRPALTLSPSFLALQPCEPQCVPEYMCKSSTYHTYPHSVLSVFPHTHTHTHTRPQGQLCAVSLLSSPISPLLYLGTFSFNTQALCWGRMGGEKTPIEKKNYKHIYCLLPTCEPPFVHTHTPTPHARTHALAYRMRADEFLQCTKQ